MDRVNSTRPVYGEPRLGGPVNHFVKRKKKFANFVIGSTKNLTFRVAVSGCAALAYWTHSLSFTHQPNSGEGLSIAERVEQMGKATTISEGQRISRNNPAGVRGKRRCEPCDKAHLTV